MHTQPAAVHPSRSAPICRRCQHCHWSESAVSLCDHPSAPVDLILGGPRTRCEWQRSEHPLLSAAGQGFCGPEGRWFEIKADRKPPASAGLTLHDYLSSDGALSPEQLCQKAGIKNLDQLRQWRHGYDNRQPGPAHCVAIERATNGQVTRAKLRPEDFWLIWPDLANPGGAQP